MSTETVIMRGICPHGKVRFACSIREEVLRACRKDISEMVVLGYTFDRIPLEQFRKTPMDIDCIICDEEYRRKKAEKRQVKRKEWKP